MNGVAEEKQANTVNAIPEPAVIAQAQSRYAREAFIKQRREIVATIERRLFANSAP